MRNTWHFGHKLEILLRLMNLFANTWELSGFMRKCKLRYFNSLLLYHSRHLEMYIRQTSVKGIFLPGGNAQIRHQWRILYFPRFYRGRGGLLPSPVSVCLSVRLSINPCDLVCVITQEICIQIFSKIWNLSARVHVNIFYIPWISVKGEIEVFSQIARKTSNSC